MTDSYTHYETGVRALLARLGREHPRTADAQVYQQRLHENLAATRRYGDTEARRAERAEIVDRLNALAQAALGLSFNALCGEDEAPGAAPPSQPITYVDTGGGAYVGGNVTVEGGDFVGRDQTQPETTPPASTARPAIPAHGKPQDLIIAALKTGRLLMVWADVPFPPEEKPPNPPALLINRWQQAAETLRPLPWPVPQLPPATILTFDPTDRIEVAFQEAEIPLNVLRSRRNVVHRRQHNLIKLAGDLDSCYGLLLTWADVRDVPNDPDKVHLLQEAREVAKDGVVLIVADSPGERFVQLWNELVSSYTSNAKHCFTIGPSEAHWPAGTEHVSLDVSGMLSRLINIETSSPPTNAHEDLELINNGPFIVKETKSSFERVLKSFVHRALQASHTGLLMPLSYWRVLRRRRSESDRRALARVSREQRNWETVSDVEEADVIKLTEGIFRGLSLELTEKEHGLWVTIHPEGVQESVTDSVEGQYVHRFFRKIPVDPQAHEKLSNWLEKLSQQEVDRIFGSQVHDKLDRLLVGQEGLRRGQVTIYRRLSDAEKQQVVELQETAIALQRSNAAALGDLQRAVDSLRRALIDIRNRQLASMDEDVREILHEVTEVLGADVGIGTELQLLIPFLPFLVKVDLGGSVDVQQLVENLIARMRQHNET